MRDSRGIRRAAAAGCRRGHAHGEELADRILAAGDAIEVAHACTLARWSRPALSALTTLALAATLASASVLPDGLRLATHEMEVKMFASTLAVSMAASNLCDDILINHDMIADFHDRLHITPADKPAVGDEGSFANQVLLKAIAASGGVKTWCDETYELYGPKGTMIPDLMKR